MEVVGVKMLETRMIVRMKVLAFMAFGPSPLMAVGVDGHDGLCSRLVVRSELEGSLRIVLRSVPGGGRWRRKRRRWRRWRR